jgi:hypothetical protein
MRHTLTVIWSVLGVVTKYTLASMGAYALIRLYVHDWGWPTTIWFLGAPLVFPTISRLLAPPPRE